MSLSYEMLIHYINVPEWVFVFWFCYNLQLLMSCFPVCHLMSLANGLLSSCGVEHYARVGTQKWQ